MNRKTEFTYSDAITCVIKEFKLSLSKVMVVKRTIAMMVFMLLTPQIWLLLRRACNRMSSSLLE